MSIYNRHKKFALGTKLKKTSRPAWIRDNETKADARRRVEHKLLAHLSAGKSARSFCRQPCTPALDTVMHWVKEAPEQYARARELGWDAIAEEIIEIADTPCETQVEVSQARNRIDSRRWLLSKIAPKKYGDRLDVSHSADTASFAALLEAVNQAKAGTLIDQPADRALIDVEDAEVIENK